MKIVIVAEKPFMAVEATKVLHGVTRWQGAEVIIPSTLSFGAYWFAYQSELKSSDFPCFQEPVLRPYQPKKSAPTVRCTLRGVIGDLENGFVMDASLSDGLWSPESMRATTRALVDEADLIVRFTDPDHRGAVSFYNFLTSGRSRPLDGIKATIVETRYRDLSRESILQSFSMAAETAETLRAGAPAPDLCNGNASARPWRSDAKDLRYGLAKDMFDYSWNLNARALLSLPLRNAGIPSMVDSEVDMFSDKRSGVNNVPAVSLLSKYVLLFLLHWARTMPEKERNLAPMINSMAKWKGTGRYDQDSDLFGSCASRATIMTNLYALGLIERLESKRFRLTAAGLALSAALPKDAYDPDLPFRLDEWCSGWPETKPAMERYMNRYFGSIKRTNNMSEGASESISAENLVWHLSQAGLTQEEFARRAQVPVGAVAQVLAGEAVPAGQMRAIARTVAQRR